MTSAIRDGLAAQVKSQTDIRTVIGRYVALKRVGNVWKGLCPFHSESDPSFTVYASDRHDQNFHCYGCGADGDVFDFLEMKTGSTFKDVLHELAEEARVVPNSEPYRPNASAGTNGNGHTNGNGKADHGPVVREWHFEYRDEHGAVITTKHRKDYQDGHKVPWYDPKLETLGIGVRDLPLYGLDTLLKHPDLPAIVVEGEKCAQLIRDLGYVAVSLPGGASQQDFGHALDILKGRDVYLWPDHDQGGLKLMGRIAVALHEVGARSVSVVYPQWGGIQPKNDAADFLAYERERGETDGAIRHTLEGLMRHAMPASEMLKILFPSIDTETGREFTPGSNAPALMPLDELLNAPEEQIDFLHPPLMVRVGATLWVAKPKVGKSTTLRTAAMDLARAGEKVIYLALEESRKDVADHFRKLAGQGVKNMLVLVGPAPEDGLAFLKAVVEEHRPSLVVVDPMQRLTRIKDLNDYAQVYNGLSPYTDYARAQGFHLALTHHLNKTDDDSADAIMASTAIYAVVDCAFLIHKNKDGVRTIKTDGPQRGGVNLPETVLTHDEATGRSELGDQLTVSEAARLEQSILDVLTEERVDEAGNALPTEYPELEEKEIRERVGARAADVARILRALADPRDYRVVRGGAGRKGDPYVYRRNQYNSGPKAAVSE
jgi:hypothetical protein